MSSDPKNMKMLAAMSLAMLAGPVLMSADAIDAQREIDEIMRGGGPKFDGYPRPRSPAKRLLLGELNESNAPAPKQRKFRHNKRG